MPHDVFISYSSTDAQVANAVCHALEAEGLRCWIAPRDALPGHKYQGSIVRAIRGCRLMILIFSAGSNQSDHVLREVTIASEAQRLVLPFRIENVEIGDDLYYYVSSVHWLDAITPPLKQHIDTLVSTVRQLLQSEATPAAEPEDSTSATPPAEHVADANIAPEVAAPGPVAPPRARGDAETSSARRWAVPLVVAAGIVVAIAIARSGSGDSAAAKPATLTVMSTDSAEVTSDTQPASRVPSVPVAEPAAASPPLEAVARASGPDPALLGAAITGNWRSRLRRGHTLPNVDSLHRVALASPGSSPYGPRTADAEAIVEAAARAIAVGSLPGSWRCRSLQITSRGWFFYPYFQCRIALERGRLTIRKLTGSQRFHGDIYRYSDDLFVILGVSYVWDGQAEQSYEEAGDGVYALEQLSRNRLRVTSGRERSVEVWELVR